MPRVPRRGRRLKGTHQQIIQRWLTQHKKEHGARRRITRSHAVLRSALSDAQRLQLVSINAAELVKVPIPTKRPITALGVDKARVFRQVAGPSIASLRSSR